MIRAVRALIRALGFLAVLCAVPAGASDSALFILDGSGSMWERVDGQPKIVTAKKVMGDLLKTLPSDLALGFMTYGTHRKGDCADISLMTPVGAGNAGSIAKEVNTLRPKGDTPIAAALLKAGDALKNASGKRTIVLVTDGAEECHGDPCASVKQLEAAGLDVHINVVGFKLGDRERAAVQCIAQEGRGQYFDANSTAGLSDALKQVGTEVAQAAPLPPPPPPAPPNLLATAQGGQLLAAPNASWQSAVSGKDGDMVSFSCAGGLPADAIFAFKDNQTATFSEFQILIPGTGQWVKDFELFAGDNGPGGDFRSLGKFATTNLRLLQTPYQPFTFAQTTAKFFKFRIIDSTGGDCDERLTQIRLIGTAGAAQPQVQAAAGPDNNLLSPAEGGTTIVAPNASWPAAVSGKDADSVRFSACGGLPADAVFGFKDGRSATFAKFEILIPSTGQWVKDFELLAANDSPNGNFHSLGKFSASNMRMMQSPYQAFAFAPTTARYFKFRIVTGMQGDCSNALTQIRLAGTIVPGAAAPRPKPPAGVNLLAASQGGKVLGPAGNNWSAAVSGKDGDVERVPACGGMPVDITFAFRGGKQASFSTFEMLVPQSGEWVKDFELLAANDKPNGAYRSLGKFTILNARYVQDPYQQFHFAGTVAKFFKLRLLSGEPGDCNNVLTQIRLLGVPAK